MHRNHRKTLSKKLDNKPRNLSAEIKLPQRLKATPADQLIDDGSTLSFKIVASTSNPDRVGDVIEMDGMSTANFEKNPVLLFAHNHSLIIGKVTELQKTSNKLLATVELAAKGTSRIVNEARMLVLQGILKAASVSISLDEYSYMEDTGGYRLIQTELLELSLVAVPANAEALRSKGAKVSKALQPFFFSSNEASPPRAPTSNDEPPRAIKSPPPQTYKHILPTRAKGAKKMDIAEKIRLKQEKLIAVKDRLTELKAVVESDEGELAESEVDEIEALSDEQDTLIKSIESLEKIEGGLAKKAMPVQQAGNPRLPGPFPAKEKGGALLSKVATAKFFAHVQHRNVDDVLKEMYGHDDRVLAVHKTATGIADTTTVGWAAELVYNDITSMLDELRPLSVYAALATMGTPINFGAANSITIPRRSGDNSTDLAGAFVGESGVIPVKSTQLGSATLNRYKMAVISCFSKELARTSSPAVESIIRESMLNDTAVALDYALLDAGAAVAGVRPASILNGVTGTASTGADAAGIVADIKALYANFANGLKKPVLIMNGQRALGLGLVQSATGDFLFKAEIGNGTMLGVPVIVSPTVPAGTIILVDANYFATGLGVAEIDVSDTATLTMANSDDTAPTQAGDAVGGGALGTPEQVIPDGGIPVAGGTGASVAGVTARSMFQVWSVAVRDVMPVSWAMTSAGKVATITGAAW